MLNDASASFVLNFSPTEKQKEFFRSEAKFTAYGGARGGGKSFALRYKLILLCLAYPGIRVLLIRRSYPELRENHIRPLCEILCGKTPIAKYRELEKSFEFLCGSHMLLGYLSSHDDLLRYQGLQFDIIAVDEATQIDEEMFLVLCASLRGANDFPKRMYLTCNPGGVGHGWVKRLFIDGSYREGEDPEDYLFIPASVYDNAALMESDPDYVKRLEALPEGLRAAWLCGRWDVFSGQFFSEFDERKHVVAPVGLPDGARYYCAMDYGLDMLAALFIAVLPDGRAYVYDEIYESGPLYGCRSLTFIRVTRSYTSVIAGRLDNSSSGSTPCEYIFNANVMISTLPVLSPFPNNVPSTLSPPASKPISLSATAQPLSLWGCKDTNTFSRYFKFLHIYST